MFIEVPYRIRYYFNDVVTTTLFMFNYTNIVGYKRSNSSSSPAPSDAAVSLFGYSRTSLASE